MYLLEKFRGEFNREDQLRLATDVACTDLSFQANERKI